MSWHDLIDDSSVRRFVSGEGSWLVGDDVAPGAEEAGVNNSNHDVTEPPSNEEESVSTSDSLSAITDLSDSGITIVPSVPSSAGIEQQQQGGIEEGSGVVVEHEVALFSADDDDTTTDLSLHPSSVASSLLTEGASFSGSISEISSVGDSSSCRSEAPCKTNENATTIDEKKLRALYLQQNNSEESWEENREFLLEVLQAVGTGENKDPDAFLAQLYEEEETLMEQVKSRKARQESFHRVYEATLAGALVGFAAAVVLRILRPR